MRWCTSGQVWHLTWCDNKVHMLVHVPTGVPTCQQLLPLPLPLPPTHTSTASLMAMPSDPGELGSFSRMARPDAVSGDGDGCSVAPLRQPTYTRTVHNLMSTHRQHTDKLPHMLGAFASFSPAARRAQGSCKLIAGTNRVTLCQCCRPCVLTSTASWSSCTAWRRNWHAPATPAQTRGNAHSTNSRCQQPQTHSHAQGIVRPALLIHQSPMQACMPNSVRCTPGW
jgi:hypothetical protein